MKFFVMLSLLLISAAALAMKTPGEHASTLLQDLQKQGIHEIGALNIRSVLAEMESVQWQISPLPPPREVAHGRRSAHYNLETKTVILTEIDSSTKNQELLETHEALGVLGYRDQNYSLTTALNILRNAKDKESQAKLIEAYGKSTFRKENLKVALGGSSVSGGGDAAALEIKNRLIEDIMFRRVQVDISFFEQYPEIHFEPMMDTRNQQVGVQYSFRPRDSVAFNQAFEGVRLDNTFQEFFIIYFPALLWSNPRNQAAIIKDIEKKILSVFPVTVETPSVQKTWRGICRHDIDVNFPQERDAAMDIILSIRAGLLTGCLNSQGTTVRTPGL